VKIILRADVDRLGNKGDLLDVADGYARNYLLPRGLALAATTGALAQAESMREARSRRDAADRESAEALRDRLSSTAVRIPAQSGTDGRLFGSVTAADVADAVIAQLGVELDRKRLHLDEPIRALGVHDVTLRLHPEVEAHVSVEVVAR
jgi:large subunit ribosomal protein L9